MSRQYRLIVFFIFSALFSAFSPSAFSAGGLIGYCNSTNFSTGCFSSAELQAKNRCGNTTNMRLFGDPPPITCNSSYCLQQKTYLIDVNGSSSSSDDCFATINAYYCPDGKDWDSATSSCITADPCKSRAGMYYNNGQYSTSNLAGGDGAFTGATTQAGQIPLTFCQSGCQMSTENLEGGASGAAWYGRGNPRYTGVSCTAGDKDSVTKTNNTPEYDCVKSGKGFGYVNGNVVCTEITNTQAKGSTTTTKTNADGTKTEVRSDQSVKCDGTNCVTTTTTTTTTFNSSGTQVSTSTTSESTSKPDPSASGTGTGTKGDSSFCASNPSSPMCKDGSFSGACSSGTAAPACDGDPVQCATAKATFEANCKTMRAGDPPATSDPVGEKKVQLNFSNSDLPGGSSCPATKSATVMGHSITFDFSFICQFAGVIKPVVIAMGWLIAGFIVFGYRGKGG